MKTSAPLTSLPLKSLLTTALALGAASASASRAEAAYVQTNLVSNIPGLATITDPNLVNPWGVSYFGASPFWVSNQGSATSTLYAVTGSTTVSKESLTVAIPSTGFPAGPTGQVANTNTSSFPVGNGGNGGPAHFIFANLNGSISAWDAGTTAFIQATAAGGSYTGLAINQADTMLYAANGVTGAIDVFNSSFAPTTVPGGFIDPNLPAGYVPFNVQDIGGDVYVTYALAGHAAQAGSTAGDGYVDVYNEQGDLLKRLVSGGPLAAPWGIALAPASFGKLGGDLLVGNFSYDLSEINAFNPVTGTYEGSIGIDPGPGDTAGGLWALDFGGMGNHGSPDTLYFTDGLNGETAGLFGAITSVPEPATWATMALGFAALGIAGYRKQKMRFRSLTAT